MSIASPSPAAPSRAELFRLLGDEGRLRLLALAAEEELTVGELSELLDESQPQVSRKASPLRQCGILSARRDGTRTLLRLAEGAGQDAVVHAALTEGRRLAQAEGSLGRVAAIVLAREERSLRFFEEEAARTGAGDAEAASGASLVWPGALRAALYAMAPLLPRRQLALDIGAGDGQMLELLAPLYERVFAVDKSRGRLAQTARRAADGGFVNVRLFEGGFDDGPLHEETARLGGADLVFAGRILHHVARPPLALAAFARLLRRGGHLVLLDYLPHGDEGMREQQADLWLGFEEAELGEKLRSAGLEVVDGRPIPGAFHPDGPDAGLPWFAWVAVKA